MFEEEQENYYARLNPYINSMDKAIEYFKKRKSTYINGQIPAEDEGIKKLLVIIDNFIEKVHYNKAFSGVEKHKLTTKIQNVIMQKLTQSKTTRIRGNDSKLTNTLGNHQSPISPMKYNDLLEVSILNENRHGLSLEVNKLHNADHGGEDDLSYLGDQLYENSPIKLFNNAGGRGNQATSFNWSSSFIDTDSKDNEIYQKKKSLQFRRRKQQSLDEDLILKLQTLNCPSQFIQSIKESQNEEEDTLVQELDDTQLNNSIVQRQKRKLTTKNHFSTQLSMEEEKLATSPLYQKFYESSHRNNNAKIPDSSIVLEENTDDEISQFQLVSKQNNDYGQFASKKVSKYKKQEINQRKKNREKSRWFKEVMEKGKIHERRGRKEMTIDPSDLEQYDDDTIEVDIDKMKDENNEAEKEPQEQQQDGPLSLRSESSQQNLKLGRRPQKSL